MDQTMAAEGVPPRGRGFGLIGAVCGAHFFSHVHMLALPPLLPLLHKELGVSYSMLAALMIMFNLVSAATQVPAGMIIDRIGAPRLLVAALVVQSLAFIAIGSFGSYWGIMAFMALVGLGNAVFHPADYAILSHEVRQEVLGRAFSFHTLSGFAGSALAPGLMVSLALAFDWRTAFHILGIVGLVGAAVVAFGLMRFGRGRSITARAKDNGARPLTLGQMMTRKPILLAFLFWVLIAVAQDGISYFSVAAFDILHGLPLVSANMVLTSFLVGTAAGIFIGGIISDRTPRHVRIVAVAMGVSGLLVIGVSFMTLPLPVLMAAFAVTGICWGMAMPSRDLIVRAITPEGSAGSVFGFVSTGFNVGSMIGPMLFGLLLDHRMGQGVFLTSGMLMLLTVATLVSIRPATRRAGT